MREIYYMNSKGEKICLNRWPYRVKRINLQNWEWDYDAVNIGDVGGKIRRIFRNVTEFDITITVCTPSNNRQQRLKDVKNLYEGLEYDAAVNSTGRLYIGPEYMQCFFKRSQKTTNQEILNALDNAFSVVSPYPMWCRDEVFNFYQFQGGISENGLNYPYNYPYNYAADLSKSYLENANYRADDFKMVVYGPVNRPRIIIGGNTYEVAADVASGEYMVINSREKEVYKVGSTGIVTGLFNSRSKVQSIFTKIPPGKNIVLYSGGFSFDITLFHERSEPDWTLL